jgi:hypothetical protein
LGCRFPDQDSNHEKAQFMEDILLRYISADNGDHNPSRSLVQTKDDLNKEGQQGEEI